MKSNAHRYLKINSTPNKKIFFNHVSILKFPSLLGFIKVLKFNNSIDCNDLTLLSSLLNVIKTIEYDRYSFQFYFYVPDTKILQHFYTLDS